MAIFQDKLLSYSRTTIDPGKLSLFDVVPTCIYIPYSGKFSWPKNFADFVVSLRTTNNFATKFLTNDTATPFT